MWRSAVQVCLGLHFDRKVNVIQVKNLHNYSLRGGLAQLARALAWHARGQRLDPVILHAVDNRIRMVMNRQTIFDMLLQTKL